MMRHWTWVLLGVALGFSAGASSSAVAGKATRPPQPKGAEIAVDEANGMVRIIAGGREVVMIDSWGVHVSGSIEYRGMIIDTLVDSPAQAPAEGTDTEGANVP